MGLLGPNAHGELPQPGRVPDCYLGLLLRADAPDQAPGVLVVSPAGLLHPVVPQPDGALVYELVTGHPDRQPQEPHVAVDQDGELLASVRMLPISDDGIPPTTGELKDAPIVGYSHGIQDRYQTQLQALREEREQLRREGY